MLLAIVFGYYPFQQSEKMFNIHKAIHATYNAFYRSCWAIAIAWIIFACHNGKAKLINWFLCLPVFQPFARMSLSIYLTHRVYQILSVATIRQPFYLSPIDLLPVFFGDIVMSVIVGTFVHLSIEAPFAILESHLFRDKIIRK